MAGGEEEIQRAHVAQGKTAEELRQIQVTEAFTIFN
jgi:hypothetical protein